MWPIAIALTFSMVVVLLLYLPTRTTHSPSETTGSIAAPGVKQPEWDVKTFPAGGAGVGPLDAAQKKRLTAQREPVAALITDVYDALFLERARLDAALRARFTQAAAEQARVARLGLPAGTTEVTLKRRVVRAGIHMQGASRAAARVMVSGRAVMKGRRTKFQHEATLWLERSKAAWKVIAFDVTQGPTP